MGFERSIIFICIRSISADECTKFTSEKPLLFDSQRQYHAYLILKQKRGWNTPTSLLQIL